MEQSLRCDNENANPAASLGNALYASLDVWTAYGRDGVKIGRITSGKLGACARDLVRSVECTVGRYESSCSKPRLENVADVAELSAEYVNRQKPGRV